LVLAVLAPVLPFWVLFWLVMLPDLYLIPEPRTQLQAYPKADAFLRHKMLQTAGFINLLFVPQLLLSLYFYHTPLQVAALLGSILLLNLTLTQAILLKYARFSGSPAGMGSGVIFALQIILFIPLCVLLPVGIWWQYRTYNKALWNLRRYLP